MEAMSMMHDGDEVHAGRVTVRRILVGMPY